MAISVIRSSDLRHRILITLVIVAGLLMTSCSSDEGPAAATQNAIERSPELAITIPSVEPLVVGVSSALTGPAAPRGQEYRDAVVVAVEDWKERTEI